jgi:hypothetical protein
MKLFLFLVLSFSSVLTYADETNLRFHPIVTNWMGWPQMMNHMAAEDYCRQIGASLPDVREFALFAKQNGAKGIRETKYPGVPYDDERVRQELDQAQREGYADQSDYIGNLISEGSITSNTYIQFYYSVDGYRMPNQQYSEKFWTSKKDNMMRNSYLTFSGPDGYMFSYSGDNKYAVICVDRVKRNSYE